MSIQPNFEKRTQYFWVHKAALTLFTISRKLLNRDVIGLHLKRPKKARDFHRVSLVVVRTKREADVMNARMERRRIKAKDKFSKMVNKMPWERKP